MKQKLVTMLELQDAMNARVNPDWHKQGNEWYRAIWIECAELMDHYGWKWWKSQTPDLEQVALELIDIWHFGISIALESVESSEDAYRELAEKIEPHLVFDCESDDFRGAVEAFALSTLSSKQFDTRGFADMMTISGLSFDELFRRYVAKNVLNIFRQDHGYKDGSYIKIWGGLEDNQHLMEVLNALTADELTMAVIYDKLSQRYAAHAQVG